MSANVHSLEDQGFLALASYQTKLTLAEGLLLGAGAAVATGFAYAACKASQPLSDWSHKSTDFASIRRDVDALIQNSPNMGYSDDYPQGRLRGRQNPAYNDIVDEIANNVIEHGFTKKDIEDLLETKFWPRLAPLALKKHGMWYVFGVPFEDAEKIQGLDEETARTLKRVSDLSYSDVDFLSERSSLDEIASFSDKDLQDAIRYAIEGQMDWHDYLNDGPGLLKSAIKLRDLGLTIDEVSRLGFLSPCMTGFSTTPKDVEIIKKIVKKFGPEELGTISRAYTAERVDRVLPSYEDLETIASLDYVPSDIAVMSSLGWQYTPTLEDVLYSIDEFKKIPRHLFKNFDVYWEEGPSDAKVWDYWQKMQQSDDFRDRVFKTSAIVPTLMKNDATRGYLQSIIDSAIENQSSMGGERLDFLAELNKSGVLKKIVEAADKQGVQSAYTLSNVMDSYRQYKKLVPPTWNTWGELNEALSLLMAQHGEASKAPRVKNPVYRTLDRLAAKDPEWAISEYPSEYTRGQRIAPLMRDVVDHVEEIVRKGDTVVIHGRDGELIYDLLMRRPGIPKSRVKYAITSRPLTTEASFIPDRYRDYLGRMVPKGAVHIDTGFAGSIPEWFDRKGYEVKDIRLVSATNKAREIPVTFALGDQERRDIVLSDLEHSSQRLDTAEKDGWGNLRYSYGAPGYHARKYGVYDALGIPRLRSSTPKTRYEEQKRVRISANVPELDLEKLAEVDEEALKMAK